MEVRRLIITERGSSPLCQGCGLCCSLVILTQPAQDFLADTGTQRERRWLESDLVELDLDEEMATGLPVDGLQHEGMHFYRCRLWDPATGQCSDYANRPDVCRRFPYYLAEGTRRRSVYTAGCRLADFIYSLRDLEPGSIELRENGHV